MHDSPSPFHKTTAACSGDQKLNILAVEAECNGSLPKHNYWCACQAHRPNPHRMHSRCAYQACNAPLKSANEVNSSTSKNSMASSRRHNSSGKPACTNSPCKVNAIARVECAMHMDKLAMSQRQDRATCDKPIPTGTRHESASMREQQCYAWQHLHPTIFLQILTNTADPKRLHATKQTWLLLGYVSTPSANSLSGSTYSVAT